MVSATNEAFMQFDRRAEASDPAKLVETFVNIGALSTLIANKDHQIMFGRRGTGKTHAFHYLKDVRTKAGDACIYIDLRTVGSSQGIYTDPTRSLPERSTTLLRDVFMAIHDGLLDYAVDGSVNLAAVGPILDQLADAISNTRVVGPVSVKDASNSTEVSTSSANIGTTLKSSGPSLSAQIKAADKAERKRGTEVEYKVDVHPSVVFGRIDEAMRRFSDEVKPRRVWILLDEWSTIPIELQPYLADLIRRALLPVPNVTTKIAAIEHRTKFRENAASSSYIGIEVGADAAADINLDDFMVFDNDPTLATKFFADLVYRHYKSMVPKDNFGSPDKLIAAGFTQRPVFDELVKAAEGVPRDAINILNLAAQKALADRINSNHVRAAARDWYQRDKSRVLSERAELDALLNWIINDVIGSRQARAFLLPATVADRRIEELFDARVLHILKKNVSSNETPGVRYRVYKIDYGCYVDLINTAKSPSRLFQVENEPGDLSDVEVPVDDYRSIRRAILDLAAYENSTVGQPEI